MTLAVFWRLIAWLGKWDWLATPWPYLVIAAGWVPWLLRCWKRGFGMPGASPAIARRQSRRHPLRQVLMHFTAGEITGQPLPTKQRTDDRFELLAKFQGILERSASAASSCWSIASTSRT